MFQCLSYFAMIELQVDGADYQVVQSFLEYIYKIEYKKIQIRNTTYLRVTKRLFSVKYLVGETNIA